MTQSLGGGSVKFKKKYHAPFSETYDILKELLKGKRIVINGEYNFWSVIGVLEKM